MLILKNVTFRCPMPRKATGEFDYMVVKLREPKILRGAGWPRA